MKPNQANERRERAELARLKAKYEEGHVNLDRNTL